MTQKPQYGEKVSQPSVPASAPTSTITVNAQHPTFQHDHQSRASIGIVVLLYLVVFPALVPFNVFLWHWALG